MIKFITYNTTMFKVQDVLLYWKWNCNTEKFYTDIFSQMYGPSVNNVMPWRRDGIHGTNNEPLLWPCSTQRLLSNVC